MATRLKNRHDFHMPDDQLEDTAGDPETWMDINDDADELRYGPYFEKRDEEFTWLGTSVWRS